MNINFMFFFLSNLFLFFLLGVFDFKIKYFIDYVLNFSIFKTIGRYILLHLIHIQFYVKMQIVVIYNLIL